MCTVAVMPAMLRPFYLVSGLMYPSIRRALADLSEIGNVAKERVRQRQENDNMLEKASGRRDILDKLFELQNQKGEKEDFKIADVQQEGNVSLYAEKRTVEAWDTANHFRRFAGSDTTAIAMRAILHSLLTHPPALSKLMSELDEAYASGVITLPVKYSDAFKLPYFTACVKEGMRLHPSIGLQLPQHPPPQGCEVAGYYFLDPPA